MDGSLRRLVKFLGHELPAHSTHRDLQKLLDAVRGRDEEFAVNLAVLRSMERAEYSPKTVALPRPSATIPKALWRIWQAQFGTDKSVQREAIADRCVSCHQGAAENDFMFTWGRMQDYMP